MATIFRLAATNGGEKSAVVFADDPAAAKPGNGVLHVHVGSAGMTKADALEQLRNCEARITEMDWPADS